MKHGLNTFKRICIGMLGIFALVWIVYPNSANASEKSYVVSGKSYEIDDETGFSLKGASAKNALCFGEDSIGNLSLEGAITDKATYGKYIAYGATDEITLSYSYAGEYQTKDKENWNLTSSDEKTINGTEVEKKVEKGAVLVQKSSDGSSWSTVYYEKNIFDKHKDGLTDFCSIGEDDVKTGTYYRIYVAYRMKQKTGTEKSFFVIPTDVYAYKEFVERYDFYVCYDADPLTLRDIDSGEDLGTKSSVSGGFIVDKSGTEYATYVSKNNGTAKAVSDLTSFTEPGSYKIEMTSDLGKKYSRTIKITDGSKLTELTPLVYTGGKSDKYEEENEISAKKTFGITSCSKLKLGTQAGSLVTVSEKDGYAAYGVTGKEASLYLNLSNTESMSKWEIYSDTYGKKEKETICGTQTGEVATGALVIQKSTDGSNWENVDLDKYADGLYTTDFYKNYGDKGDVLIYTPDGDELIKGLYLRVIYAYELKEVDQKKYDRNLEVYKLYLCSNELGAVTFHNLSATDDVIRNSVGADDEDDLSVYKKAETLLSGSGTTTGFSIDTSLNPTVTYTVKRDGQKVAVPENHQFTADGKYEISLKSAVGDTQDVVIFVDKDSADETFENYFAEGFINSDSKRIYSEGEYPTFEGGQTSYTVSGVNNNYLPISGTITNTTTGEVIEIVASRTKRTGEITEPGEYVAVFTTQQTVNGTVLPGDYREYTFRFSIIAEGTAPGPKVNQDNLKSYAASTMVDSYPKYYGVTYQSASKGNITLAFATKEAAQEYAYQYEKGTVEEQEDGTYRYTGSFLGVQKDEFVSAWDLTEAMNYFAEQAVQPLYFDMSDTFTYLTLSDSDISKTKNLRTLELDRSVTIFADGEKENLCEMTSDALPIIGLKPCAYLAPGVSGKVTSSENDFEFISDKYGCDSKSIIIKDCNEKQYVIEYNKGVAAQLEAQGCPSGKITICESTCYGDSCEYQAVYLARGENTAEIKISYYVDDEENNLTLTQADEGKSIEAEAFKISELTDKLDPYAIVKVSDSSNTYTYVSNENVNYVWTNPGEYTVSVINRLGNKYSFNIDVVESEYATISFSGIGTEDTEAILTKSGANSVELPKLNRYGYNLVGFEDESGTVYNEKIENIAYKGEVVLKALWRAKTFNLTYADASGDAVQTQEIEFGKKYELENLSISKDPNFVGWSIDGELIDENVISVDKEGDITLVACMSGDEDSSEEESLSQEKGKNGPIIALLIVALLICGVVLLKRQKNADIENENKIDTKPNQDTDETERKSENDEDK